MSIFQRHGAFGLEVFSAIEVTLLVEMIGNRCVNRGEFLQTSHLLKTEHRPFTPSKWLVLIFNTIVPPAAGFLPITDAELLEHSAIGTEVIRHQLIGATITFQRFLEDFQRSFLVARLRHEAFKHLSRVLDGPPKIVLLPVDLYEDLIPMPPAAA